MPAFSKASAEYLRNALQEAVVKCSERCLYQSAKWYEDLPEMLRFWSKS